ncbi:MAG: response regulator, partial [Candidatus Limnocylindria bacterium]
MPPRILVVDDEESVAITMAAILEMDGYAVATALRGADAIAQIEAEEFDLVLTDLRLDDFDGLDVLAAARRRSAETVGIVLTGYASLESAVKALREGAYDYLLKPAEVEELRATVARGIERRKLGEQLRARIADLEAANRTINELNEGLQDRVAGATAELEARVRELDAAQAELQSSYEKLQELDKL